MAWTAPADQPTGTLITAAIWNNFMGAAGNMKDLELHVHDGANGQGASSLGALVKVDFTDAAAPAAPGAGKTRLFTTGGLLRFRAGAAGADTPIFGIQDEGSDLTQRAKLDFRGAMVKASDDSGSGTTKVDVDRRQTITHTAGTLAIDFANGTTVEVALQANTGSMTFTGLVAGMWFSIQFAQDGTGGRTIAFASTIKWEGGTAPTFTTTASKKDKMLGYYDGTDITAIAVLNS